MLKHENQKGSTIRQDMATQNNQVNDCFPNATANSNILPAKSMVIALQQSMIKTIGLDAAVMLSQALYWQKKMGNRSWYKTQQDWKSEIGLSRRQQERARSILRAQNPCFWVERYAGNPRRLYYLVDMDTLSSITNFAQQVSANRTNLPAPSAHASKSKYDTHYSKLNQKIKAGDFSNATSGIDSFLRRHLDVEVIDYE